MIVAVNHSCLRTLKFSRIFKIFRSYFKHIEAERLKSFFKICIILNPMTMSVPKGQFSFPLTSCTKERKASISGADRDNRMLCMSSMAIQCNIETRPSNLHIHSTKITYIVHRHVACTIRL